MAKAWIVGGAAVAALVLMKGKASGAVLNVRKIDRFAEAIAYAEGFRPGALPWKNNNPGDLKASRVPSVGKDPQGHLVFATPEDGWKALRLQLELIVSGGSSVYNLDMTIKQMGAKYAEWSGNWSHNVAARLSVSEDTTLRAVLT